MRLIIPPQRRDRWFKSSPRNQIFSRAMLHKQLFFWAESGACPAPMATQQYAPHHIKPIQRSSVVERSAVNRLVVGSNPTAGAKSWIERAHSQWP
jgi:hypothetical protein